MESVLYKIRSVVMGALAVLVILLIILMLLDVGKASVETPVVTNADSMNAVTVALSAMVAHADAALKASGHIATDTLRDTGTAITGIITATGRALGSAASFAANLVWQNFLFVVRYAASVVVGTIRGVSNCFVFAGRVVDSGFGLLTGVPSVSAMIQPGAATTLPTIDAVLTRHHAIEQTAEAAPVVAGTAAWPIHGTITTHYGVPHWPFQPRHTGMDISSGNRSGVMPIKPFRPGIVTQTIHSRYGLGNHVVVDHGGGITSTYAHLYNITVTVGQAVGMDATLGHEGSTGLSTGPHLHLEIHKDGQLQNPQDYIAGNP